MRQSQYHFVWPNTTINISPGPQNVSIECSVPLEPPESEQLVAAFQLRVHQALLG
jgi:hypothetical protein